MVKAVVSPLKNKWFKFITFEPSYPSIILELDSWDFPDQGTPWWGFWSRLQQVEIRSVLRLRKNAVIVWWTWWDVLWSGIPSAIVTADRALNVDGELIFSHLFKSIMCLMFSFLMLICKPLYFRNTAMIQHKAGLVWLSTTTKNWIVLFHLITPWTMTIGRHLSLFKITITTEPQPIPWILL